MTIKNFPYSSLIVFECITFALIKQSNEFHLISQFPGPIDPIQVLATLGFVAAVVITEAFRNYALKESDKEN
ncbi:MAG TPA: hypothetical protein V6D29_25910 [Leptolyngbyaceae cyanobacterium]